MVAAVVTVFVFIFLHRFCCSIWSSRIATLYGYATGKHCSLCPRTLIFCHFEGDIPEAEAILASIKPAGVVSRADVVLPNQFQALRKVLFQSVGAGNGYSPV